MSPEQSWAVVLLVGAVTLAAVWGLLRLSWSREDRASRDRMPKGWVDRERERGRRL